MGEKYVIGVDYGSLSGRAVVVRVSDGKVMGTGVYDYDHAVLDKELLVHDNCGNVLAKGVRLQSQWALQVPNDYRKVLFNAVPEAVREAKVNPHDIVGIATDFTACTMIPCLIDGTPLNELDEFSNRPHAYVKLWKHHAAGEQAERITKLANEGVGSAKDWIDYYGGSISSEWEYAKGLQLLEEDPEIYHKMDKWVEAADWIVWQLCGEYIRNACTAGYKGIYQQGKYPSEEFERALNPDFVGFANDKLNWKIGRLGKEAGKLTAAIASRMGLPEGISVAVGNVDAHCSAPAVRATKPGQMVAIMGTSTCHVMNGDTLKKVKGMCGVVDGGIIDGLYGYEAGQSGVGDIFNWFTESSVNHKYFEQAKKMGLDIHSYLSQLAETQKPGEHGLMALDWHSGNRSILVDHELSGMILGQTLQTKPEDQYRALVEATAFGARRIVEEFCNSGVQVKEFIACGGLIKNKFLMQTYADILNMPISISTFVQGPALGAAIHATVAAGEYDSVDSAAQKMGNRKERAFIPNKKNAKIYDKLYAEYRQLYDYFGKENMVTHRLRKYQREVVES